MNDTRMGKIAKNFMLADDVETALYMDNIKPHIHVTEREATLIEKWLHRIWLDIQLEGDSISYGGTGLPHMASDTVDFNLYCWGHDSQQQAEEEAPLDIMHEYTMKIVDACTDRGESLVDPRVFLVSSCKGSVYCGAFSTEGFHFTSTHLVVPDLGDRQQE